jgi:predicted CXXCH cytochrome family protein
MLSNDCHFHPIYYTNGDIETSTEVFVLLFERRSSRMYLMIGELVMGRTIITWLLICGLGLIALGFAMSLPMQSVRAQDDSTDAAPAQDDSAAAPAQQDAAVSAEQAEYIGLNDCEDCHRNLARDHVKTPHALALQDVEKSKKAILGDFEQGADVRMVQFPGEDAPRPFTADDIVFAIGSGRYAQRYVYEVEKRVYAVFPAEWDTVNQVWQPYTRAESWPAPEYDFTNNCAGCHTTGLEVAKSKWEDEGVQCEACHGPGSIHKDLAKDAGNSPSDEEALAIHGAIVLSPDAQICGQCHSQGMEVASDSAHPFSTQYRPGGNLLDPAVFQLVGEEDANAWYASGHGRLNNMQLNEWLLSAHSTSLETMKASSEAANGCVTCHSGDYAFTERILSVYAAGDLSGPPPDATTLANAQFGITCTTCHSPHDSAKDEDFQLTSAAYEMCTGCHANTDLMPPVHHPVKEMFEGQAVIDGLEGIPSVHFSAEDGPRCVTCHMQGVPVSGASLANHTWKPVIPGKADSPPDACSECHKDLTATDLQSLIEDTQDAVRSRISIARARLGSVIAPEAGSPESVQYDLVVKALTFVQNDGSLGVHNYAYADALLNEAAKLLSKLAVPGASLEPAEAPAPTATPSGDQMITVGMELPVRTGFRPMTFILVGVTGLVLVGGVGFILRQSRRKSRNQETTP